MRDEKNYIIPSAIIGGALGGMFKYVNPGYKTCQKIANLRPKIPDIYKGYWKSFNLDEAANALEARILTRDEYLQVKRITDSLENVIEKENALCEIIDTPFSKRKTSYKTALKETNKAHSALKKEYWALTKSFQDKLIELKIFDKEKFREALKVARKIFRASHKERAKSGLKGLAIGIPAGALIGVGLNKIAHSDK